MKGEVVLRATSESAPVSLTGEFERVQPGAPMSTAPARRLRRVGSCTLGTAETDHLATGSVGGSGEPLSCDCCPCGYPIWNCCWDCDA